MGGRTIDPFIQVLKKRREELGLSRARVAGLTGVSRQAISDFELGKATPTIPTLRKIAHVLKMQVELTETVALSVEKEILYLRSLNPEKLEQELMSRSWYVHPNDLIGGYCVMPIDAPPSSGCFSIADFMVESHARHIVELHNRSVGDYEEPAVSNLEDWRNPSCVERWPGCFTGGYDPKCCRFPKSCSC